MLTPTACAFFSLPASVLVPRVTCRLAILPSDLCPNLSLYDLTVYGATGRCEHPHAAPVALVLGHDAD